MDKELVQEDDILRERLDKKQEQLMFLRLSEVEGLMDYLRQTIYEDLLRFYNVPKELQDIVRGNLERSKYMLDSLRKTNKKKSDPTELTSSPRHA